MRKTRFIMLASIFISFVVLVGCGAKDEKTAEKKETDKAQTEKASDFINSNDSYFIVIDGKKFSAGDKIADLSSVGYNLRSSESTQKIPANKYMIGAGHMNDSADNNIFTLTPFNTTNESIQVSDAWIGGLDISDTWAKKDKKSADFEVYGGIKLGSTEEEVKKVFGEPSSVVDLKDTKSYKYKSDEVYRDYDFTFDKDQKVTGIKWQNLVFNQ